MRRFLSYGWIGLVSVWCVSAAPQAIYINSGDVNAPPDIAPSIDATAFLNEALFNINVFTIPEQPYETLNTRFFTNSANGVLMGSPGFRFDYFSNNRRRAMDWWVNEGSATGDIWMMAWANNIVSTGPINTSPFGLVRLQGDNIDLTRASIRAGLQPGGFLSDGFQNDTNYFNPAGVFDIYWGRGSNNVLGGAGNLMRLDNLNNSVPGFFNIPCTISPTHQVTDVTRRTNTTTVPLQSFFGGDCFKQFDAHAFVSSINPTTRVVQVAFVSRNLFDSNFTSRVRFVPDSFDLNGDRVDEGRTIMVEFAAGETDLITRGRTTNTVYLVDRSAFATNVVLLRPFNLGTTRRPHTLQLLRNTPFAFVNTNFSSPGNVTFTPELLYNSSYLSNAVPVLYSAYRASVDSAGGTNANLSTTHPSNFTGRVEIFGTNVNLTSARIRAESTAHIKARNLIGNNFGQVDAPFLIYDLGTSAPEMVISNLAPATVRRLSGQITAWSATWENIESAPSGDSTVRFHVLIVDSDLQSLQGVTITDLALRARSVVVRDSLAVRDSLFIDATNFHLIGNLSLPSTVRWAKTNVPNILNFTNDGSINIQGTANFGADRPGGYANFINRGTNVASAHQIRANNFENTGSLIASSGLLTMNARNATVAGAGLSSITTNLVTNVFVFGGVFFTNISFVVSTNVTGQLQAGGGIDIFADTLSTSNSYIRAGTVTRGALNIAVTNRLTDGGPGSSNYWAAAAGIRMTRRPNTASDLLSTHLHTIARDEGQEVFNVWVSEDRGAVASGYDNNFAVGKLTLDGAVNTLFHFDPPAGQTGRAIYVDYLELVGYATNENLALEISPNMRVYFANANIDPEKLDGAAGGRLIWVSSYAGALSSTNIVYPSPPYPPGTVVRANVALAQSVEIDSDGDNIVNADDPDPFFIGASVALSIEMSKNGKPYISWNALAKARNIVECAGASMNTWTTLTNFVQGNQTTRVKIEDSVSNTGQCVYRVRVVPPQ